MPRRATGATWTDRGPHDLIRTLPWEARTSESVGRAGPGTQAHGPQPDRSPADSEPAFKLTWLVAYRGAALARPRHRDIAAGARGRTWNWAMTRKQGPPPPPSHRLTAFWRSVALTDDLRHVLALKAPET